MSDELTIQAVNQPQVQQKKKSTTPYVLGGVVGGGLVGAGVNSLVKKPTSWEDVVKEAKDTTDFSTKAEPASWEGVKSKAQAVEDAKKALEEASKPQLADSAAEKQVYDKAVKEKEEAFNKLYDQKKAALENTATGDGKAKLKTFDQLGEYPETNVKTGKAFTKSDRSDIKKVYDDLIRDYNNAETRVENAIATGVGGEKSAKMSQIKNYMDAQYGKYATKTNDEIDDIFAKRTELKGYLGFKTEVPTKQYEEALQLATREYPEFTSASLKPEQYLEFGEEVVDPKSTSIPKGYNRKGVHLIDPATKRPSPKTTYIDYKMDDLNKFVEEQEKLVAEKRTAYADELFTNAHESVLLRKQKDRFMTDFGANVEKGLATQSGYYNPKTNVLNMSDILNESKRNRLTVGAGKKAKIGYAADMKELNRVIKAAEKAGTVPAMPAILNGYYAGVTDPKVALEMAGARNAIATSYNKELNDLVKKIDNCVNETSVIQTLDEKIADIKANDKGLQKAKAKLTEQFPNVFKQEGAGLTAEQIDSKAKEYAEKNLKKSYQEAIDAAKTKLDEATGKKGVVNEELKKQAQSKLDDANKALREAAEELGKKFKKGGTNKWVAAGIGAVIGAAALYGVAASKNKKAV